MESQSSSNNGKKLCRSIDESIEAQKSEDCVEISRTLGDGQEEVMTNSTKLNAQLSSEIKEKIGNIFAYSSRSECAELIDNPETVRTDENDSSFVEDTSVSSHVNALIKSSAEFTILPNSNLSDSIDKLLKPEEQTERDTANVSENEDLLTTDVNNLSVSLSEDRNNVHSNEKEDSFSIPNILSLLRVWSDDSPHRLKNLEHAALIMKNLLCEHLPGFAAKESIPDTPECLLILLQDCLCQYRGMINALKSRQRELELELEESRRTGAERYHVLVEEHKERLSRVFQDHEQQLTAAVERAINSRRQAGSLHAQLALAQARIEQLETQGKEYTENILVEHRKKLNELHEEKQTLLTRIEQLEQQMTIKDAEIKSTEERNRDLNTKKKVELLQEQEYLKKLEKQLATEISTSAILKNELKQEQQHNHDLWLETDRKAQELAVLHSKLETSHDELAHKDHLLQMLREEILEKFSSDCQESLDHSSLLSDNGMSFSWLSSIKQQISNTNTEIQEKSSMLALKELTLTDVEKELKKKELKIENIKEEQNITELEFQQLSDELNKKKEQINKLTLHNKKAEKKMVIILEQATEKSKLLQSLKDELEETNSQIQQMMLRIKEENLKIKNMESNIITSEQFNKQLIDKLKFNKKQEELLKNQCLLKQSHIDHLHKVLESKNKIIINLEQQLNKKDSQLTNLISTTDDSTLELINSNIINTANSYILPVRENDKIPSIIKRPTFDRELTTFCSNARKNYNDTGKADDQHAAIKSRDENVNLLAMQPTRDHIASVKDNQSTKCRKRLEKFYSPSKLSHSDSGHISGSSVSPLPSFSALNESVSRDVFLNNNQFVSSHGLKSPHATKKQSTPSHNQIIENDQQPQKESSCLYSHTVTPSKVNSPLTVNINLQPPCVQSQREGCENSESERMCYNVAIDMKSLYTPPKKHKTIDPASHHLQNKNTSISNKIVTPQLSGYHPLQMTPECGMDSLPNSNSSSKQLHYPRVSTPVMKQSPVHKLIHTDSGFTVYSESCSSEQEERLPVEGGEQI